MLQSRLKHKLLLGLCVWFKKKKKTVTLMLSKLGIYTRHVFAIYLFNRSMHVWVTRLYEGLNLFWAWDKCNIHFLELFTKLSPFLFSHSLSQSFFSLSHPQFSLSHCSVYSILHLVLERYKVLVLVLKVLDWAWI